jgi:hypothetical protein
MEFRSVRRTPRIALFILSVVDAGAKRGSHGVEGLRSRWDHQNVERHSRDAAEVRGRTP